MVEFGWWFIAAAAGVASLAPWASDFKQAWHPALRDPLQAMPSDPLAFEHWCAAVLASHGWKCRLTARSGDDGVDVVARKGAVIVAIQVKSWSRPVTKVAVQEVVAGRPMYGCTHAAVISRSGYMPSTIRMARVNRVILLDAHRVHELNRLSP